MDYILHVLYIFERIIWNNHTCYQVNTLVAFIFTNYYRNLQKSHLLNMVRKITIRFISVMYIALVSNIHNQTMPPSRVLTPFLYRLVVYSGGAKCSVILHNHIYTTQQFTGNGLPGSMNSVNLCLLMESVRA